MIHILPFFDTQNVWFRRLVIAGVILVSAGLGMVGSPGQYQTLINLVAVAGVLLLFLRKPPLGIAAMIAGTLLIRFSLSTGTQTRINMSILTLVLIVGLWVFHMVAYERSLRLVPSRTTLPLLIFGFVAVLAFGFGQLPWFLFAQKASLAAQVGGLALFILSISAFLLVGNQIRELRWLEIITYLFLGLSALYILSRLGPTSVENLADRYFARGLTAGSLFWTWIVILAFSQAAFNTKLHPGWRLALAGLTAATLYVSVGTNNAWTSGWFPAVIGVGAALLFSGSLWFWAGAVVGGAAAAYKFQGVLGLLFSGDNTYSLITRLEAWRIMAEIIKVNPLLGLGPANYYWYTPLYSILGYYVQFNSHNNYIDILAQTGLLGMGCFLWFAWEVGRLGWSLLARVPEGFARAYVLGALGGLVGTLAAGMLGDWILPFIYNIGYDGFRASMLGWVFLGGLLALEQMYPTRRPEASEG